jgi:hypothetical protein
MYRFLQFRLRTLLLLIALAAGVIRAAEWWFRPYVIEEHLPCGTLKCSWRVRWDWRRNVIAWGEQIEYHPNGQIARRWLKWSGAPGGECSEGCEHWSEAGSTMKHGEPDFESLIDLITSGIRIDSSWLIAESCAAEDRESEPARELVDPIATGP